MLVCMRQGPLHLTAPLRDIDAALAPLLQELLASDRLATKLKLPETLVRALPQVRARMHS
jgi:hypothetical protein